MLLSRFRTFLLVVLAGAATAEFATAAGVAASERALVAAESAAAAGPVEPSTLPGNTVTLAANEPDSSAPEPPLPAADPAPATEQTDAVPQEVAATPRRFRYSISVDVRGVYDDNVTLAQGARQRGDFYTAVMPKLTAGVGDLDQRQENFVAFSYAPSAFFYFANSGFDAIEQIGLLEGQWRIRRVTLRLSQDFQSVQSSNLNVATPGGGFANQTNLDVGGRRRVTNYATRFEASAEITGKTSVQLGAGYQATDPEGLIASQILSASLGFDYHLGPKLTTGVGFVVGKTFVDNPSPDQTFEQMNLRGAYEVTGKINATGSIGVEFRQSDNGTQDNVSPVFQIGLAYAPFDGTQIDISATGRTLSSASEAGQDFTSTQFVISARQRLLQRFYFNISAGVQNQSYFSALNGSSTNRDDNYYFIAPGVDVRITNFWYAGVFYTHRENSSSRALFSFDDNQYGVSTTLTF